VIFMMRRSFDNRRRDNKRETYYEEPKKEIKPIVKEKRTKMPKSLSSPSLTKTKKGKTIVSTSKRKTAIARATIKAGKGKILINKKPYELITNRFILDIIKEPLMIVSKHNKDYPSKVDVEVNVHGGGSMGQVFAIRNAITKSIVQYYDDLELAQKILDYNRSLLIDDVRRVESKKPLGEKARAKKQHSKR